jgi:hypothetical protein
MDAFQSPLPTSWQFVAPNVFAIKQLDFCNFQAIMPDLGWLAGITLRVQKIELFATGSLCFIVSSGESNVL